MRKINIFIILLIASLISLTILMVVGFYVLASPYPWSWMTENGGYMGGMMGGSGVPVQNPASPYFTVVFVVLVGFVIASVGGLVYFLAFPEIKTNRKAGSNEQLSAKNGATAYEAIVKTLTDEERRVIQVLTAHDGKYLQKYIRKEAGLSRLKTHRIVARLADRGIVTLKKSGNTNEVQLSDWLRKQSQ
jgi:uncharacterized membrane protein